jgi:hypothetical protein
MAHICPIAVAAQAWETAQSPLPPSFRYFSSGEQTDHDKLSRQGIILAVVLLHRILTIPVLDWCFINYIGPRSRKWQMLRPAALLLLL